MVEASSSFVCRARCLVPGRAAPATVSAVHKIVIGSTACRKNGKSTMGS
ncbi:hypothetical protein AKJ09_00581 [Labilithrix luteola]|uniref:Uncharacterized protein n=1 Tax=Labilithrix luteola TaxID=1391654 RepID=A0A0K1PK73_9BACT|nr:hypothetical protein AKJ09_00581 [Labilithrix luteola]